MEERTENVLILYLLQIYIKLLLYPSIIKTHRTKIMNTVYARVLREAIYLSV